MPWPFIDWPKLRADALYIAGSLSLALVLLFSYLYGNTQIERIDALSQGPYVIERNEGQMLYVDGDSMWTPKLEYAQRFATKAQAQSEQSRIGGMIVPIREAVR